MCSSPKGSTQCFRQTKRKEFSRSEYEEHARMMRRASAVYDRIEQEKAERRQAIANQKAVYVMEDKQPLKNRDKVQVGLFSGIKNFFYNLFFRGKHGTVY